ncbi:MAG: hypothetical protein QOI86_4799, partial [Actinomycetota bacterium]|nr:hypothetical protein [Actinomycetota bacterium]
TRPTAAGALNAERIPVDVDPVPDLLVAPEAESPSASARPPEAGRTRRRARWRAVGRNAWLPLAAAITTLVGTLVRFGYGFGMEDQAVIALKGVARADPAAFVGDWFTHHVPQPHWLFDLVTFIGERLGVLPLVYLAWWAASLLAFGLASVWLSRRFIPERPWLALLVGPVLALGPQTALGSGTALWGFALPQGLGACLGFLTVAALVTGRWRAAVVAAVLTALAHVQHGADLGPILLATAALATLRPRRHRLALAGVGAALVAQAGLVGHLRGIDNGGAGWLDACRLAIPFHCDANTWPPGVFVGGAVVVGLAVAFAVAQRRDWRILLPAVGLPAGALLTAAIADRLDLPVVGHLAQQYNVYRLAGLVLPVAAFALIWLAARLWRGEWTPRLAAAVTFLWAVWLTLPDAAFHQGTRNSAVAVVLLVAALGALTFRSGPAGSEAATTRAGGPAVARFALVPLLLLAGCVAGSGLPPIHFGYDRSDPGVAAALAIGGATEPGAVIAADPAVYWLRAVSRRAVVAECKGIAFGGDAWTEDAARIEALGGWACTPGPRRFAGVTLEGVEALHDRYGVTHVLLAGDDPKLPYAKAHWSLVVQTGPRAYPLMESGWWLFRIAGPTAPLAGS